VTPSAALSQGQYSVTSQRRDLHGTSSLAEVLDRGREGETSGGPPLSKSEFTLRLFGVYYYCFLILFYYFCESEGTL